MEHQDDDFWKLFDDYRVFAVFDEIHHCSGYDPILSNAWGLRIPRHPATQPTNIRPPIPRSSGRAVGAQRRRFALLV
jgi:hypothetical protein